MSGNDLTVSGRILIVEDSDAIRTLMSDYLRQNGFDIYSVTSLLAARAAIKTFKPDVLVLDLGLDDGDGTELMSDLKASGCGCIVVSSRSDISDRLKLLELGADDYLIKPFDLHELFLRVRNMLTQRLRAVSSSDDVIVEYNGIRVVLATRSVIDQDGKVLTILTDSELLLIRSLSQSFGAVVTRKDLYTNVFGRKSFDRSRALDVLVSKLRHKLKDIGTNMDIKSVRGSGYMLLEEPDIS